MKLMLVRVLAIVIPSGQQADGPLPVGCSKLKTRSPPARPLAFARHASDGTLSHVSKILDGHFGFDRLFFPRLSHWPDRPHYWQSFCNSIAGAWAARHGLHECAGGDAS